MTCDRSVVSSTNKTDCHDITEILLKVALNTIRQTNNQTKVRFLFCKITTHSNIFFLKLTSSKWLMDMSTFLLVQSVLLFWSALLFYWHEVFGYDVDPIYCTELEMKDIRDVQQKLRKKLYNKNVNILFSAHDVFLKGSKPKA